MGAWDVDTFDNDTACDWACALEEKNSLNFVEKTLEAIIAVGGEYLDSDEACEALAACEVVARLKGNWGKRDPYTTTVDKWVDANAQVPADSLVELAIKVIDRVQTEPSELLELWEESDGEAWKEAIDSLRERVQS